MTGDPGPSDILDIEAEAVAQAATAQTVHRLAAEIDTLRRGLREIIANDIDWSPGVDTAGWDNTGDISDQASTEAWHAAAEIARATLGQERAAPSGTICRCGSAKDYHRAIDRRDHEYEPLHQCLIRAGDLDAERLTQALRRLPDRHNATIDEYARAIAIEVAALRDETK